MQTNKNTTTAVDDLYEQTGYLFMQIFSWAVDFGDFEILQLIRIRNWNSVIAQIQQIEWLHPTEYPFWLLKIHSIALTTLKRCRQTE